MATASEPASSAVARRLRVQRAGLITISLVLPLTFFPWAWTPFIEAKLLVLAIGTILMVAGVRKADRAIGIAGGVWIGLLILASVFSVDRAWSFVGPEILGNGLLLLVPCGILVIASTGLGRDIARALPRYIVWAGLVCSVVAIIDRLLPSVTRAVIEGAGLPGGTVGHPVILSGLLAAAIVATFAPAFLVSRSGKPLSTVVLIITEVVLATGLAFSSKRAGWVALAVGIVVVVWRMRPERRTMTVILAASLLTLAGWTVVDALGIGGPTSAPLSAVSRFSDIGEGSSVQSRLVTIPALAKGVTQRPILGWGPGNTWSAYLTNVDPAGLAKTGERGIGDAHNIVLESAVTTGILGLAALLWLLVTLLRRMWPARGAVDGWAPALFLTLLVFHLFQPMTLSLLPMLFVSGGVAAALGRMQAASDAGEGIAPSWSVQGWIRTSTNVVLVLATVFAVFATASAISHFVGRDLDKRAPLQIAVALNRLNLAAEQDYALALASHGTAGDVQAARNMAEKWVGAHPANPASRLAAAQIFYISGSPDIAQQLERDHLARFPADTAAVEESRPVSVPQATAPETAATP